MSKTFRDMKAKWQAQKVQRDGLSKPRMSAAPLTLPKGEPQRCFYNAMCAVWKHPDRLVYVEGYVTRTYSDGGVDFYHHAWVKDRTGTQHELTIRDTTDFTYTGIEFTKEQLTDPWGDPLESPEDWTPQLTIGQERKLLQDAGYDVVLCKIHDTIECETCSHERWADCPNCGRGEQLAFIDPDTRSQELVYMLNEGFEHSLWTYMWRTKELLHPNATVQEQAVDAAEATCG